VESLPHKEWILQDPSFYFLVTTLDRRPEQQHGFGFFDNLLFFRREER